MRRLEPRAVLIGLVALAVLGSVALAPSAGSVAAAPQKRVATCSFNAGSHLLDVQVTDLKVVARIQRKGDDLIVRVGTTPLACAGPTPTVSNVDRIAVFSRTELALDIRNGPLAPGFTDEGDGSSEIEVDARFSRTGGLRVRGSAGGDSIRLGELDSGHGVNLNSREANRDADVTVDGGLNVVSVLGRGGNDIVSARGGSEFKRPLDTQMTVSAGIGRDRLIGTANRDLLGGGAGPDYVKGGRGADRIRTQGGSDTLRVRDRRRDFVQCGPGEDRVAADRRDRLVGCDSRG